MNNNQVLPTIAELANKTKASTTQVCLRVKDSTKEFFEQQAKTYSGSSESDSGSPNKVSANSLMTTLLDSYVEGYATQHANFQNLVNEMRTYLRHQARLSMRSSDDQLLYRIYRPGFKDGKSNPDYQFCLEDYDNITQLCNRYNRQRQGEWEDGYLHSQICYELHDDIGTEIHCVAPSDHDAEYYSEIDDNYHCQIAYVSIRKWLMVVSMVDAYVRKVKSLMSDERAGLTADALQKLVELINDTDLDPRPSQSTPEHCSQSELAFKLAEFLTNYMEQVYV